MRGRSLEGIGLAGRVGIAVLLVVLAAAAVLLVGSQLHPSCVGAECDVDDGPSTAQAGPEAGGDGIDADVGDQGDDRTDVEPEPWQTGAPVTELSPVQVGKRLTGGNCEGAGAEDLTHLPMRAADIGLVVPYGSTTGAHVTPIDHQYFYPSDFELGEGSYPAYAMSDGHVYLIDYSEPSQVEDTGIDYGDYGVYITQTCTQFYYETILMELSPRLQAAFEANREGDHAAMYLPVTAGERIGTVGGNSIDFAVFDTTRQLEHFTSPELYLAEPEKLYIADPFQYYTDDVREAILPRYPRTAAPLGGRIDYDVEGRLRGNWFLEGTNGYAGAPDGEQQSYDYWRSHLAIYPDHFDPSATIVSTGDFAGGSAQLATAEDSPDPASVGVGDGPIAYPLFVFEHEPATDEASPGEATPLVVTRYRARGCALFEMPAPQRLRAEFFPGTACADVPGFTDDARVYER